MNAPTWWRQRPAVLVGVTAVVLLSGCGGTGEEHPAPVVTGATGTTGTTGTTAGAAPVRLADGTSVGIDHDPPDTIGSVAYNGTITVVEGGCWALDGSGATTVLFLLEGTAPSADGSGVVTPDGVELHAGDSVSAAGYGIAAYSAADQRYRAESPECFEDRRSAGYLGLDLLDPAAP